MILHRNWTAQRNGRCVGNAIAVVLILIDHAVERIVAVMGYGPVAGGIGRSRYRVLVAGFVIRIRGSDVFVTASTLVDNLIGKPIALIVLVVIRANGRGARLRRKIAVRFRLQISI